LAVAVVTGAASGIGAATAARLSRGGHAVALVDRDAAGLERVERELQAAGASVRAVVADVARADECGEAVAAAAVLGPLTLLVNVAGIMVPRDTLEGATDEDLERLLAVNVLAIFRLGRHAVPAMRAAGGGVIVNVSSVHAFASMPGCAAYAASKGAIIALTRQLALDLAADGIRVVAVAPGAVDTPLTRRELERRGLTAAEAGFGADSRAPGAPTGVGRVASPDEVAAVIALAAAPGAELINGSVVVADAGLLSRLV
jgi:NAD(P)-dependent dehydrogenase (short-subunit alcohol dehydrogenase family)